MTKRKADHLARASNYIDVLGSKMHYLDEGVGDPILFLHGIPTSSYIWRNVIPHLSSLGRCIAPDLIGFGKSDKPNIAYSVFDHIKYIKAFIEVLHLKNITLIMHGWGSVIGFDYAMNHQKNCKGLVFYEAFLKTLDEEDEVSLPFQEQLSELQMEAEIDVLSPGVNFIDRMIPQHSMQSLPQEDMNEYREPFKQKGSVKPIIQYLKELPNGEGKSKIDKLIQEYTTKLTKSEIPKLMLYSVPGFVTPIQTVMWAKTHLPNIEIIDIGEELHLAQESNPDMIGESVSVWLQGVEQMRV